MLVGHVGEYVAGLSGKDVEELGTLREEGGNRIIKVKIHAQVGGHLEIHGKVEP